MSIVIGNSPTFTVIGIGIVLLVIGGLMFTVIVIGIVILVIGSLMFSVIVLVH